MRRTLSFLAAIAASLVLAAPAWAITNGVPDDGEHPYVGELIFYVPDAQSGAFNDPGGWFSCTGTLVAPKIVVTAGHCTFGVGLNEQSTTHGGQDTTAAQGGVGGNDIWFDVSEAAHFDGWPESADYGPDENPQRTADRLAFIKSQPAWQRGRAYPHPQYDDVGNNFLLHDAGVVVLDRAVRGISTFGRIPTQGYLDRYASQSRADHRFEAVGYGTEQIQGKKEFGGDTRMKSEPKLDSLNGNPRDTYIVLSNNTATGGTCFGDSGGPTFDDTNSRLVVAVTSWGQSPNCGGKGGAYRLDQPDDLAFLATFGIRP
jgi:hypothetical protein